MKRKFLTWFLFGAITLLLSSCGGNDIYFDLSSQSVTACSGKPITKINITKSDYKEDYFFRLIKNASGSSSLSLTSTNADYEVNSGVESNSVVEFILKPSSQYTITNTSDGGKLPQSVTIKTDNTGKVTSASLTKCP